LSVLLKYQQLGRLQQSDFVTWQRLGGSEMNKKDEDDETELLTGDDQDFEMKISIESISTFYT
jgi:hypothetical protein